jgi:hypothetical protein
MEDKSFDNELADLEGVISEYPGQAEEEDEEEDIPREMLAFGTPDSTRNRFQHNCLCSSVDRFSCAKILRENGNESSGLFLWVRPRSVSLIIRKNFVVSCFFQKKRYYYHVYRGYKIPHNPRCCV